MDAALYADINGLARYNDQINAFFEFFAKYGPYVFVGLLLLVWFWPGQRSLRDLRQWAVINATAAAAIALGVNQIIIRIWARPRPFMVHPAIMLLTPSRDPSFPSDHATFAFGVAVALFLAMRRVGIAMLLLAALIAFARVFTGEHYVTDVIAGAFVGSSVAWVVHLAQPFVAPVVEPPLRLARKLHLA
ncbi:MAG TPA: phosphatase PAP2 family protein [Nitrolancea sp.]|nr:phosphatase PAP2 family protein [Nitrolancea sp.]